MVRVIKTLTFLKKVLDKPVVILYNSLCKVNKTKEKREVEQMITININTGYGLVVKKCKAENLDKVIALLESKGLNYTIAKRG
jgi:hypothetical protein